jgi:hypothetical protein
MDKVHKPSDSEVYNDLRNLCPPIFHYEATICGLNILVPNTSFHIGMLHVNVSAFWPSS